MECSGNTLTEDIVSERCGCPLRERHLAVLGALDRLLVAVFIVGDDGSIITRNPAAIALVDRGDVLTISSGGCLRAVREEASQAFASAVADALDAVRSCGHVARRLVVLPGSGRHPPCVADVSPVHGPGEGDDGAPCAVQITVVGPHRHDTVDLTGFDLAYRLSVSEAAIARLVVDGLTNAEVAGHRNVSCETVKTQIRSLFDKTGARNRTELTRLALALDVSREGGS